MFSPVDRSCAGLLKTRTTCRIWVSDPVAGNRRELAFSVTSLAVLVDAIAGAWAAPGVMWQLEPVSSSYGEPVITGQFESVAWIGGVAVSISGGAELAAFRLADGWNVSRRCDLASPEDPGNALDELAALIDQGPAPDDAVTTWAAETAVAPGAA